MCLHAKGATPHQEHVFVDFVVANRADIYKPRTEIANTQTLRGLFRPLTNIANIQTYTADDFSSFNVYSPTYELALRTCRQHRLRLHQATNSMISPTSSMMTSSSSFAVLLPNNCPSTCQGMRRDHLSVHRLVA